MSEYPLLNPHPSLLVVKEGGGFFLTPSTPLAEFYSIEKSMDENMFFDYYIGTLNI